MIAVSVAWTDKTWLHAPIFAAVSPREATWLRSRLRFDVLGANAAVFNCEPPSSVAVLLSGAAKVTLHRVYGGEVTFAILGYGEMLGEEPPGEMNALRHQTSVTTLEETRLARLSRDDFAACLQMMPTVSRNLLTIQRRRLTRLSRQAEALATLDVCGRVASQLLQFADDFGAPNSDGVHLELRFTQHDLAGLCGASRERVNAVLAYFKRRGWIFCDAEHRMTLHDLDALQQRCR